MELFVKLMVSILAVLVITKCVKKFSEGRFMRNLYRYCIGRLSIIRERNVTRMTSKQYRFFKALGRTKNGYLLDWGIELQLTGHVDELQLSPRYQYLIIPQKNGLIFIKGFTDLGLRTLENVFVARIEGDKYLLDTGRDCSFKTEIPIQDIEQNLVVSNEIYEGNPKKLTLVKNVGGYIEAYFCNVDLKTNPAYVRKTVDRVCFVISYILYIALCIFIWKFVCNSSSTFALVLYVVFTTIGGIFLADGKMQSSGK